MASPGWNLQDLSKAKGVWQMLEIKIGSFWGISGSFRFHVTQDSMEPVTTPAFQTANTAHSQSHTVLAAETETPGLKQLGWVFVEPLWICRTDALYLYMCLLTKVAMYCHSVKHQIFDLLQHIKSYVNITTNISCNKSFSYLEMFVKQKLHTFNIILLEANE